MQSSELFNAMGSSILMLALYIVFLVGIPYIIAFAARSILILKKVKKKKADKLFWIFFIIILAIWNAFIFILEFFV